MSLTRQKNASIQELVRQARRRFFMNVAVAQAVLAGSVGMAGAILLLIFGAQFLDWRWMAFLAVLTFPLAYFRTARGIPSAYRVAQLVDARLELRDSISTAFYFSEHSDPGRATESMRQAQFTESERIGGQIDPKIAVPLAAPRTLSLLGALFMIAAILFGLRYGVQRKLDFGRPLVRILIDAFGGGNPEQRADLKKNKRFPPEIWNQMTQEDTAGPDSQLKEDDDKKGPATPEEMSEGDLKQQSGDAAGQDPAGDDAKKEADGSKANGEDAREESDEAGSAKDGDASKPGEDGKQSNASDNNSLASKIKDAMSNLMNSMRSKDSQPNPSKQGKSGGDSKTQQSKGQKSSTQGQKKSGDEASGPEDGQQGDAESGQPGEGKGSSQNADGKAGSDGTSGAGKQDGAKDARLAEQLKAMGQISEIIGKRSANVTGDVTIEVTSSKQPVKTSYADGKASHGEATGEINRDEVPAAFQDYVQQYFEQVRKPAKAAGKGSPTSP